MHFLTRVRSATMTWSAALGAALALATTIVPSAAMAHEQRRGRSAVFVQTNNLFGNAILAYARFADGTLRLVARYPTLGRGDTQIDAASDPLASQGSLTFDRRRRLLYAVNAGSDTVSVFAVRGTRLRLLQVIGSGGLLPTSVAVHDTLVYVLNASGDGAISGFRRVHDHLRPIAGSIRSLGLGNATPPTSHSSPAQIGITDSGAQLLVSTKGHGVAGLHRVQRHGGHRGHLTPPQGRRVHPEGCATRHAGVCRLRRAVSHRSRQAWDRSVGLPS